MYADTRRNAQESDVEIGDSVLVKQPKVNKFTITFNPEPYTVVKKTGNSVVIESPEGAQYSRNTTHVRKFMSGDVTVNGSLQQTQSKVQR